jgi:squalene-hopene/tetraprenyl-beta-curcumene cyclase
MSAPVQIGNTLASAASEAARRAAAHIARLQKPDGEWCAELTADSTLESDYILFQLWLYPPVNGIWEPQTRTQVDKAARSILRSPASRRRIQYLQRAGRRKSMRFGEGLLRAQAGRHSGGRFAHGRACANASWNWADSGSQQLRQDQPQPVRPLPARALPQHSTRSRAAAVRFALPDVRVVAHHRGSALHRAFGGSARAVPAGFNLDELWDPSVSPHGRSARTASGSAGAIFFLSDRLVLKWWERSGSKSIRSESRREGQEVDARAARPFRGLGAIYPPMMYSVMALDVLGYAPETIRCASKRCASSTPDGGRRRALLLPAVLLAGLGYGHRRVCMPWARAVTEHPSLARAADWLLERKSAQGRLVGEAARHRALRLGLSNSNDWYPDIDDTAMVMLAWRQRAARIRGAGSLPSRAIELAAGHAIEGRRLGGVRRR